MSFSFYIYTILIMGVALVTSSVALVVWLMTRRRDAIISAIGFLAYMLDLSVIFFDEYNRMKYDYAVSFEMPLQHPGTRCLLGIVIIGCLFAWTILRLRDKLTIKRLAIVLIPLAIVQFLLVPRPSLASTMQQYLFWLSRDLCNIACLGYVYWRYRHMTNKAERLDLERSKTFFKIACVLAVLVIVEDTYMILLCRPDMSNPLVGTFLWYLSERNISENVLMIVAAAQLFKQFAHMLRIYAKHPRADEDVATERRDSQEDLASRIVIFSDRNSLSNREQEVLSLVLRGLDAQNIASELVISPGTVKAHLHRIYVKSNVKTRDELIEAFWRS